MYPSVNLGKKVLFMETKSLFKIIFIPRYKILFVQNDCVHINSSEVTISSLKDGSLKYMYLILVPML